MIKLSFLTKNAKQLRCQCYHHFMTNIPYKIRTFLYPFSFTFSVTLEKNKYNRVLMIHTFKALTVKFHIISFVRFLL